MLSSSDCTSRPRDVGKGMSPGSDLGCKYCQEKGLLKSDCPARCGGTKLHRSHVMPTVLAAPVRLSAGLTAHTEPCRPRGNILTIHLQGLGIACG